MSSPVMTQNATGNVVAAGTSIGAGLTSAPVVIDASAKIAVQISLDVLTGVTATASVGATLQAFRVIGLGPTTDKVPCAQMSVSMGAASTHYVGSLELTTGKYSLQVVNGDGANAITHTITSATIDA